MFLSFFSSMLLWAVLLGTLFAASSCAEYGVPELDKNPTFESTTLEASGGSYSYNHGNEDGFASGSDALAIDTDCSNKEDGLYPIGGCSPLFLTCSGGISRVMDCPPTLIYDHRIVACEYHYNVPDCGRVPPDSSSTESSQPSEGATTESASGPYSPVEVEITTTSSVENATLAVDPNTIPYDSVNSFTTAVPIEEATTLETTAIPTSSADSYTTAVEPFPTVDAYPTTAPAVDEPVTRSGVVKLCSGKEDGFYSFGECSDHYTACSNGYTIPMQCPAQLAFDEVRVICDYVVNVPECHSSTSNDSGSIEETTVESSAELPYSDGNGYEESTTVGVDVPSSTEDYKPQTTEYASPYEIESTTAGDTPTITVTFEPEGTDSAPYAESTTAADIPTSTIGYAPVVVEPIEETTIAVDVPSTTTGRLPEVVEEPASPYGEETSTAFASTTGAYAPQVGSTVPSIEKTIAADTPTTTAFNVASTTGAYAPQVVGSTMPSIEKIIASDMPTTETIIGYKPKVAVTTAIPLVEETTAVADVSNSIDSYGREVETTTADIQTTALPVEIVTKQGPTNTNDSPSCIEGASAIGPCSPHYKNCVNGEEAIFVCDNGLFFSPEHGQCATKDLIAECLQTKLY